MKREAAAAKTASEQSEAAAKSATDAHVAKLQKALDETTAALEQQQHHALQMESDARLADEELDAALAAKEELAKSNQSLTQVSNCVSFFKSPISCT